MVRGDAGHVRSAAEEGGGEVVLSKIPRVQKVEAGRVAEAYGRGRLDGSLGPSHSVFVCCLMTKINSFAV